MRNATVSVALGALVATACVQSPTGRPQLRLVPEDEMDAMGAQAFQEMKQETPLAKDEDVVQYVRCVADAVTDVVAPNVNWEVQVFQSEQVNAFALPGGKIGVYTGMLDVAETPDQLAAVLAHEVAHVLAQHSNARVSAAYATQAGLQLTQILAGKPTPAKQQLLGLLGVGAQVGVLLPYSRGQETEADVLGQRMMARAGFDPRGAVALWQNMQQAGGEQPPTFLSTHPSHETRIEDLMERMDETLATYQEARQGGIRPTCPLPQAEQASLR